MDSLKVRHKAVDRSTAWSEWVWDSSEKTYYRSRSQSNGGWLHEYADRLSENITSNASQDTPQDDPVPRTFRPLASSTKSPDYESEYTSQNIQMSGVETADTLSHTLAKPSIGVPTIKLGSRFQVISNGPRFFKIGRVFKTLWSEPMGNVVDDGSPFLTTTKFGEMVYTKMRHFVVVREMHGCCLCLPLNTYGHQGAAKARVRSEDYAAVYPAGGQPDIGYEERMTKEAFPILVEEPTETIDPKSRINFGRVYTVEHNIKVSKVGRVPDEHLPRLDQYFISGIVSSKYTSDSSDGSISQSSGLHWDKLRNEPPRYTFKEPTMSHHKQTQAMFYYNSGGFASPDDQTQATAPNSGLLASPYEQMPTSAPYDEPATYHVPTPIFTPHSDSFARPYELSPVTASVSGSMASPYEQMPFVSVGEDTESQEFKTQRNVDSSAGSINNRHSHSTIKASIDVPEKLDPKFKAHSKEFKIHPSKQFKPGNIFKILWAEPKGETTSPVATGITAGGLVHGGEIAHSSVRRFVIIAADKGHCQCLPISTYQYQGTNKRGVKSDDHTIIYTGDYPPPPLIGEGPLSRPPIQAIPRTTRDKLPRESRIDYAKIYTVEHNVKVCFIGQVAPQSMLQLMKDFDETWDKKTTISY